MSHGYLNRRDEGLTCGSSFASRIQSRLKTGPHPDAALTAGVLPVHALPPIVDAHSVRAARTACLDRATRLSLDGEAAMTSVRIQALFAIAIVAGAADAQAVAVSEKAGSIAHGEEIPVTTASSSAKTHFTLGQRLLDVGRPREAREYFRLAVEQDPGFAYGYLNLAQAAASAPEFKE